MSELQDNAPRVHATIRPVTDESDPVFIFLRLALDPEDTLGVVEAAENIQEELVKQGEAYYKRISWRQLCFHWSCRSGTLGSPSEVVRLMDDVDYVGVSYNALGHALCAENEPDNNYLEQQTREWVRAASVPMAEVVAGSIGFNTLACSHMTQGMRSIIAKVPNTSTRLGNGTNYDVDVISQNNPALANLIRDGINWLVLK